jgi:hypothetical protein
MNEYLTVVIGAVCGALCYIAWDMYKENKRRNRLREGVTIDCDRKPMLASQGGIRTNGVQTSITLHPAINGRIVEIANYKPNPNGPDWTYEHFIVADGEPVEPAISTILLMKGIR